MGGKIKKIDSVNAVSKINPNKNKLMKNNQKNRSQDKIIKRRGRRPKKIIDHVESDSESIEKDTVVETGPDNSAVILKLPFDPSKLGIKKKASKRHVTESDSDEVSDGMFKNDIPNDDVCQNCIRSEKQINLLKSKLEKYETKDKTNNGVKFYNNNLKLIWSKNGEKVKLKKVSNIKCLWDSHEFNGLPCFLVDMYHNNTYHVIGYFCSFNCALAHNLYYLKDSKIHSRKSLTYNLYREMYGLKPEESIDIIESLPKEILEDFGGEMTIEAYRKNFITLEKKYVVYIPPLKPVSVIVEEKDVSNDNNNDNEKDFVLKRSKPLSKKRSVISTMKIHANNSDD